MKKKSKEKNDPKSPQKKLITGLDNGGHFTLLKTTPPFSSSQKKEILKASLNIWLKSLVLQE